MGRVQQLGKQLANWGERYLHWGNVRWIGNSRLVTSSVVWLFIVPIAAKLLAPFAGQHTLDLSWFDRDLNEAIAVTIALPFSWQHFYLMSWLFVIGQAVYLVACPDVVRKYANYGDYRRDHTSSDHLKVFLMRALQRPKDAARKKRIEMAGLERRDWNIPRPGYDAASKMLQSNPVPELEGDDIGQNQVFDGVLAVERYARRLWLWVSGVFFASGLALFTWVVLAGVVEVCRLQWSSPIQ